MHSSATSPARNLPQPTPHHNWQLLNKMGRAGRSLALLVVALLVVGARAGWFSKKKEPPAPQPEQKHPVIEYLEAQGGQVRVGKRPDQRLSAVLLSKAGLPEVPGPPCTPQASFKLGRACPTCPRGAIATKDLEAGELIARVPFSAAVAFPPALSTDAAVGRRAEGGPRSGLQQRALLACHKAALPVTPAPPPPSQARAYELLVRMHTDPSFNATYAAWWASQPGPDSVLVPESLSQEQLSMLQSSWLVGGSTRASAARTGEGLAGQKEAAGRLLPLPLPWLAPSTHACCPPGRWCGGALRRPSSARAQAYSPAPRALGRWHPTVRPLHGHAGDGEGLL